MIRGDEFGVDGGTAVGIVVREYEGPVIGGRGGVDPILSTGGSPAWVRWVPKWVSDCGERAGRAKPCLGIGVTAVWLENGLGGVNG